MTKVIRKLFCSVLLRVSVCQKHSPTPFSMTLLKVFLFCSLIAVISGVSIAGESQNQGKGNRCFLAVKTEVEFV